MGNPRKGEKITCELILICSLFLHLFIYFALFLLPLGEYDSSQVDKS